MPGLRSDHRDEDRDLQLSMAYIKQNGGADLNWRPTKEWNVGAAYGYERYDYTQVDANAPTRIPASYMPTGSR